MLEFMKNKEEIQQPVEKITATEQVLEKTGSEKAEGTDRTTQKQMELLGNTQFIELKYSDNLSEKQIKDFKKEMLEQGMSKGKVTDMCKELYNTKSENERLKRKQIEQLGNTRFNELKYSDNLSEKQIRDFKEEMLEQGMSKGKVTDMCKELYNTKSENERLKYEQIEHEHEMELLNMKQEWQQAEIDREKAVRAEQQLQRAEKAAEKMTRAAAKLR